MYYLRDKTEFDVLSEGSLLEICGGGREKPSLQIFHMKSQV